MRKNALIIALAVLAIVDIVLVTAAFVHGQSRDPAAQEAAVVYQPDSVPSAPSSSSPPSRASATATPGQTLPAMDAPPLSAAPPQRRFIAYGSGGAVVRATEGECTPSAPASVAPATVQLSVDGGTTFVGSAPKVTQVLRVAATSPDNLWFIGTDTRCKPWLYRTLDAGATWQQESAAESWHLGLSSRSDQVHAPGRPVRVGCIPMSMSVLNDSAYVACTTGQIRATTDGGLNWQTRASLTGVVALAFGNSELGYALLSVPDCPAAVFSTVDGGVSWLGTACLRGSKPQAIDVTGDVVMAIVDDKLQTSPNRGETWTATR